MSDLPVIPYKSLQGFAACDHRSLVPFETGIDFTTDHRRAAQSALDVGVCFFVGSATAKGRIHAGREHGQVAKVVQIADLGVLWLHMLDRFSRVGCPDFVPLGRVDRAPGFRGEMLFIAEENITGLFATPLPLIPIAFERHLLFEVKILTKGIDALACCLGIEPGGNRVPETGIFPVIGTGVQAPDPKQAE